MKAPPLLIGAALLFWGWQTGLWAFALLMAGIYEGAHLIRARWTLELRDFTNLARLSFLLLLGSLLLAGLSDSQAYFLYVLLSWMPIICFPLLAAQTYSTADAIDLRAFYLHRRNISAKDKNHKPRALYPAYPYLGVCLLSAAAANAGGNAFYAGLLLLALPALWRVRSQRYSAAVWLGLMLGVAAIGFAVHSGLHALHLVLEEKGLEWIGDAGHQDTDPYQSRTAIGDVGTLKLSDRIVLRVKADLNGQPLLVRSAVYDAYSFGTWFASAAPFQPLQPEEKPTSWRLAPEPETRAFLEYTALLKKGRGLLKLPAGAFYVQNLPVVNLEKNRFGAVKLDGGPGLISCRIDYAPGQPFDSPPTAMDRFVPDRHRPVIDRFAEEIGLKAKPPREAVRCLSDLFDTRFTYSLGSKDIRRTKDPLTDFLLHTRSGHCEYFASATVLLLRAAGIPARYVKGFVVAEFSRFENRYIVRQRHAHAWTLAYIDGHWKRLDTTPSNWLGQEDARSGGWHIISDLISYGWLHLIDCIQVVRPHIRMSHAWWMLLPLMSLGLWRFWRNRKIKRLPVKRSTEQKQKGPAIGTRSEFYRIEKRLNKQGLVRHRSETLRDWIVRLSRQCPDTTMVDDLHPLVRIHYRYRFDPAGIRENDRTALKAGVDTWLAKYP